MYRRNDILCSLYVCVDQAKEFLKAKTADKLMTANFYKGLGGKENLL